MTVDVFRRLLLLAACTVYVLALGAVWVWVAWPVAIAAGVLGPALAIVLTLERVADPAAHERQGLRRQDIGRRRAA